MDTDVSEKHSASIFRAEEGLESAVLDEEYLVPSNFFFHSAQPIKFSRDCFLSSAWCGNMARYHARCASTERKLLISLYTDCS